MNGHLEGKPPETTEAVGLRQATLGAESLEMNRSAFTVFTNGHCIQGFQNDRLGQSALAAFAVDLVGNTKAFLDMPRMQVWRDGLPDSTFPHQNATGLAAADALQRQTPFASVPAPDAAESFQYALLLCSHAMRNMQQDAIQTAIAVTVEGQIKGVVVAVALRHVMAGENGRRQISAIIILAEGVHYGHAHQFTEAQAVFHARQGFADEDKAGGGGLR